MRSATELAETDRDSLPVLVLARDGSNRPSWHATPVGSAVPLLATLRAIRTQRREPSLLRGRQVGSTKSEHDEQRGEAIPMSGLAVLPFHATGRYGTLEVIGDDVVLPRVALVAGRDEVGLFVRTSAREGFDVIDDGAQMIQERGPITSPSWIVVGERAFVAMLARYPFQLLQGGSEHDGAMAPSAEPLVALEYPNLQLVGEGGSGALGCRADRTSFCNSDLIWLLRSLLQSTAERIGCAEPPARSEDARRRSGKRPRVPLPGATLARTHPGQMTPNGRVRQHVQPARIG